MYSRSARTAITKVRPILSLDDNEMKMRVLYLYKAWYRQIPHMLTRYDIPRSVEQCRAKLKEIFTRNRDVTDIRRIDMLIIQGQMELQDTVEVWKQKTHLDEFFANTYSYSTKKNKKKFMSKFLDGDS